MSDTPRTDALTPLQEASIIFENYRSDDIKCWEPAFDKVVKIITDARQLERELSEVKEINTNVRLFDLVRFMRSELHKQNLITDDEYGWLCSSEMAMDKNGGSPSPRRLEDYDILRAQTDAWKRCAEELAQEMCDKCYSEYGKNNSKALATFNALKKETKE